MTTSESINEIAAALSKAQAKIKGALKDSNNPFFKSKYADLSSVWDACREPLTSNGLSVVQFPRTRFEGTPEPYEWVSKTGEKRYGVRVPCVVGLLTRMMHTSGQWVEDEVCTMLPTADPQAVGSAISYLRRYSLQSVAGVVAEDDDAESALTQMAPVGQPRPAPVAAPKDFVKEAQDGVKRGFDRGAKAQQKPPMPEPPPLTDKDFAF